MINLLDEVKILELRGFYEFSYIGVVTGITSTMLYSGENAIPLSNVGKEIVFLEYDERGRELSNIIYKRVEISNSGVDVVYKIMGKDIAVEELRTINMSEEIIKKKNLLEEKLCKVLW